MAVGTTANLRPYPLDYQLEDKPALQLVVSKFESSKLLTFRDLFTNVNEILDPIDACPVARSDAKTLSKRKACLGPFCRWFEDDLNWWPSILYGTEF